MGVGGLITSRFRFPSTADLVRRLVDEHGIRTALDVGCGWTSPLTALRPSVEVVGIDVDPAALERARERDAFDHVVLGSALDPDLETWLPERFGGTADLVCLFGVIEHLPKRDGYALLERCEQLAAKVVLVETPNGFVPQGAEFDNEHQRHLSGWFIHDFEGLGYSVTGTTGLRRFRGYASQLRRPGRLYHLSEVVASSVLRGPGHAFNLAAWRDLSGEPSRELPV